MSNAFYQSKSLTSEREHFMTTRLIDAERMIISSRDVFTKDSQTTIQQAIKRIEIARSLLQGVSSELHSLISSYESQKGE